MKNSKYCKCLTAAFLGIILFGGFTSQASADNITVTVGSSNGSTDGSLSTSTPIPPVGGSDATDGSSTISLSLPPIGGSNDSSSTSVIPSTDGSDTSSSTSIIPPADSSNTSSTTSIIPPIFGSNDTSTPPVQTYTLTVNVTGGNGSDTVISADGSINCATGSNCSISTTTGALIILNATAADSDTFSGWSGDACASDTTSPTCTIDLEANTSVTATFSTTSSDTNLPSLVSGDDNPAIIDSAGGNGGFLSSTNIINTASGGSASTSCPFLSDYIIPGQTNSPADIAKIQTFLDQEDQAGLPVNGILNPATIEAIKIFQEKYSAEIMAPWGIRSASGEVYITTLQEINSIMCGSPLSLTPEDIAIIDAYKNEENRQTGTNGGNQSTAGTTTGGNDTENNSISTTISSTTPDTGVIVSSSTPDTISASTTGNNSELVGNTISAVNNNFFSKIFSAIIGWFK